MTRRRRQHDDRPAVTRDVDPGSLRDLLEGSSRTCLAWATDAGPTIVPAAAWFPAGFDGAPGSASVHVEAGEALPPASREVVALVDAGIWWFDLRAVYVRGTLRPADGKDHEGLGGEAAGALAAVVEPTKVTAWHYGQLREAG
jgi:hypothetical protein